MASIWDILLTRTVGEAHCWSLPNVKGEGRERWAASRSQDRLEKFAKKRDEHGYGTFFCVSTIAQGERRVKEHALEMPCLHVDVDFKDHDLPPQAVEEIICRGLTLPPSRAHHTGNGIHAFWIMEQPFFAADMEWAEVLLRRLANHLGGDPLVAHRVALLRVPGTHNSKRGEWHTVRVIREGVERYAPQQIDAWLASESAPALIRRDREQNPFLRTAQEQAYRPPVDVDERLANMVPGDGGDAGVHATCLSCTASLMAAGWTEDDVVAKIMPALQELPGTGSWDWGQEARTLRKMCQDYVRKFGEPEAASRTDVGAAELQDLSSHLAPLSSDARPEKPDHVKPEVVSLSQARKEREPKEELSKKKRNEHVVIGKGIVAKLDDAGQRIMYAEERAWLYDQGIWSAMMPDEEKGWASRLAEEGCEALRLISTTKIVNEVRAWLARQPSLHRREVPWDDHGFVATKGGMIDPRTGRLVRQAVWNDYCTHRLECEYDDEAACPTWERMLIADYELDAGTVQFLQEFMGACLLPKRPRAFMRALVLQGPSNAGKSNILNVIGGFLSKAVNATPLKMLENPHGLMPFLKPVPWVLHEAFDQARWEMSSDAKALLSGDEVSVNVKNGPMVRLVFDQPIMWGTNVPPQFRESSRAMENRLAIVRMHRTFDALEPVGTAREAIEQGYRSAAEMVLDTERPGLLNWALSGLRRALGRGRFEFTTAMAESLRAMRADSNMALGFVEECCSYAADGYVNMGDFYGAFAVWHQDHRGGQTPSVESLGRALAALADDRILAGHRIRMVRTIAGLHLNEAGMDCWHGYSGSAASERTGQRVSASAAEVNRLITGELAEQGAFQRMQAAHALRNPQPE